MKREFYWSLLIEPGFVQAAIWTIDEKITKVMGVGKAQDWSKPEALVDATDKTLSDAISEFEGEEEPEKTVFGVPSSWVSQGQIKKEYLDLLRDVCGKLSLQPVGFVVLAEAVANFVKSEEETPLNGIVVGVGSEFLDLAVFKLGNLMGTVNVGRSGEIVDDVLEGLARFGGKEDLPSRILLYDGRSTDLEKAKQALIKADWTGELSGQIKFLHTPTVEIIDPVKKTVAVCLAGASEMSDVSKVMFSKSPSPVEDQVVDDEKQDKIGQITQNFFGGLSAADAGFVVDEDVAVDQNPKESTAVAEDQNLAPADEIPENISQTLTQHKKLPVNLPKFKLPSFNLKFLNKIKKLSKPNMSAHPHIAHPVSLGGPPALKKPVLVVGVAVVTLTVVGGLAWWFLPKADVTLYISPRQIQKSDTITLSSSGSADFSKKQIPTSTHEVSVMADRTADTTGKKLIGDKAKGKVEIRNGTSVDIKVAANTILVGPNNLKFSLDNSASVSAALSPSNPGTTEVNVTASEIGADSNLAKDQTLSVGNYPKSEVDGRAAEDFSGGSSREITAVSADDQKSLKQSLTSELLDQGRSQLNDELAEDEIIIGESITSSVDSESYSNKVGDEAATLKLSLTLKVSALVIKKSDLTEYAKQLLAGQVPDGFVLRDEQIKTDFTPKNTTDKSLVYDVDFMANLLPQVNPDEVKKLIAGKTRSGAQASLASIPGFVRAAIKFNPVLPGKLAVIPHLTKNITIEVSSE